MSNTTLTDEEKAALWWGNLTTFQKLNYINKYGVQCLNDAHIVIAEKVLIWRKETSSTPISTESGELKVPHGDWYASEPKISEVAEGQTYFAIGSNSPERRGNTYVIPGFYYPHSVLTHEEMEATAKMLAASKDLYENNNKTIILLKELQWLLIEGVFDFEQALCKVNERLFKSQEVRAKANPNYKP